MTSPPDAMEVLALAWLRELTAADWTRLDTVPELALALPESRPRLVAKLAAEHLRLFVVNVPPYETCFTDPVGTPPSRVSVAVAELYARAGWVAPAGLGAPAADHVGLQLLALAHLIRVGPVRSARLLTQRLAHWVPALAWALRRIAPLPFYGALAELTLDTVLSRLEVAAATAATSGIQGDPQPTHPADLAFQDPAAATALLLSPVTAGCYLSRAELARVAQSLCLPARPGRRLDLLTGLVQEAAAAGCSRLLWDALENLLDDALLDYTGLAADYPLWAPCRRAWSGRLERGRCLVHALRTVPPHVVM